MKAKLLLQLVIICLFATRSFSQNWIDTWQQSTDFYTIQNAFNQQCKEEAKEEKRGKKVDVEDDDQGLFPGYIQFKRWESFVGPRVYPSGDLSVLSTTWKNYEDYLSANQSTERNSNGNNVASTTWTAMGPFGALSGNATNGLPRKSGRINFITYDPSNANTFWVGTAAGGLWKTTDNGITWSTNTDNLAVIGCTDLAIDPTNPLIMYLATGDGYGSFRNPSSIGVFKSIDGGVTWSTTGLVLPLNQKIEMRRIIINPLNHLIVMAATSMGVYRTTDGGVNWSQPLATNTYDLEFKPTNPDTVYASGIRFRRSTDGGVTWVQISNGIPTSGSNRMNTAVTVANPNLVYVVSSSSATDGLQGVYRSTNAGTSFTLMASSPNIIGNDCFITSAGGQGSYDLALDASPLDQNEIVVGGLGAWRSSDGGTNWTNIGCAYNWNSPVPYVHTDHQEMQYTSTGILYDVNDGGIYEYTGTQWNDLSNPMNIAQIYKIGLSSLSPNLWITGHQDNGSNIYNNGVYSASLAADGTDNFIDRTNDQTMYAAISLGAFYKSTDGGQSWNACQNGFPGASGFITPWKQDPQVASTLYAGRDQMYRSVNSAGSWTATPGVMQGVVAGQFVTEFAIAPSNDQYIYAIHGTTGVFTTQNAGATNWVASNNGLPVASASASFITVDPNNALCAWLTFSGYSSGNKIFKTTDGGLTWTNYTANLPNLPANCSVFETGNPNQRIYVGMDVGVYYRDNLSANWTLYNTGLPNTPVMDMEISPAAPGKIRAATFGRGVYQVDVVPAAAPPVSAFNYAGGNNCSVPDVLLMNDISTNSPTSWSWSVNPSAGVTINTATSQNPTITITNFGSYTITLVASNGFGPGSTTTQTVTLTAPPVVATPSSYSVCVGFPVTLTATGANSYNWQPGNFFGPSVTLTPAGTTTYTVTGTNSIGCTATDTALVTVINCTTGMISQANGEFAFNVYPNPTQDNLNIYINVPQPTDFDLEVIDVTGKLVIQQTSHFASDKSEQQIDISSLTNGIYFLVIISDDGNSEPIRIIKK